MDLIYDNEIWGNKDNFTGTVNMEDPFNPDSYGQAITKLTKWLMVIGIKNSSGM